MADPRVEEYARLLVERSLDVQPGWQVQVRSSVLARPLVEEVVRQIARRDAYALVRLAFSDVADPTWWREAPLERIATLAPLELEEWERIDAQLTIWAPENTRENSALDEERTRLRDTARQPALRRVMEDEIPWVLCNYPCPALAQDAGMSVGDYEEFLYTACLLDWDGLQQQMEQAKQRFDRAKVVRIVGEGTDLVLALGDRTGMIEAGHVNMPGGEFFFGPREDATEGVISFSEFPAVYAGREVTGARLVFRGGRAVEATATSGEDFLLSTLDTDPGARVVGELGIGCNPGITRHTKDVGFDEKIAGTVHLALGASYPGTGGSNESAVHWDMVKDLRSDGRILLDGEPVQENGLWVSPTRGREDATR